MEGRVSLMIVANVAFGELRLTRSPRDRVCLVAASRSEPNWAKAATSRYWAKKSFREPATCFMALSWAAEPTRDTERPTLMAGRIPL